MDFEYFGLARPHGKYVLFKLTLSPPAQHLIPYYAEIFLASSLPHFAVPGSGSLTGSQKDMTGFPLQFICYIEVSMRSHRKSDLLAQLRFFHLWCQFNLDPPWSSEFPQTYFALLTIFT